MKSLLYYFFLPLVAGFLAIFLVGVLREMPKWVVTRAWLYERRRFGRHRYLPKQVALGMAGVAGVSAFLMLRGVVGGPLFGLLAPLFLLPLLKGYLHFTWFRAGRRLGEEALSFLYQLRGMLMTGRSFPVIISEMAEGFDTSFAREMARMLSRFKDGKNLQNAFRVFLQRNRLGNLSVAFSLLLEAHQNGLPLLPVLDRFIPSFEDELQFQKRVFELRSSAVAQGVCIAAIPWFLLAVLFFFQPELRASLDLRVIAIGVLWQALGIVALWRVSCFR